MTKKQRKTMPLVAGATRQVRGKKWNAALLLGHGSFLQAWEWCQLQRRYGRQVTLLAMSEDVFTWDFYDEESVEPPAEEWSELKLQAAIFEHRLPVGVRYLYIPRGPTFTGAFTGSHDELLDHFAEHVRTLAKRRHATFVRIEPAFPYSLRQHAIGHLYEMGFRYSDRSIQPRRNLIIDVTKSDAALLHHMHHKTRYNIGLAERRGVEVRWVDGREEEETFWRIMSATTRRQEIRPHPRRYYSAMFAALPVFSQAAPILLPVGLTHRLYLAFFRDKVIAAAVVVYFGKRAIYLHGGSSNEHRNVMAPHFLHWRIMQDARASGCTEYSLGGVDENRWPGLTRFKKGFAGWVEEYPGLYEMPIDRTRYRLYRILKKLKR